ncbi:MAG: lytic murein transglycosylase [Azoarcus sp.]|jgi:lytic murein transglycosylase|nr:lytic murein transglycosylase [Azoarcus sp.]
MNTSVSRKIHRVLPAALALALVAPLPAMADGFSDCLERLRAQAARRGISRATFDAHAARLRPDPSVLELLDTQPEFSTPIWDYLAALVDDERADDGRAMLERWRDVLQKVEERYGVDPATVVAVWGVESNYGRSLGKRPLLVSLGTLACMGRRQDYFRGEFLDTLKIIDEGHIPVERLTGSWAGAFGQTQFMPSTFLRLAVDFDGDGRRDLVDSAPDALASTANFLRKGGWKSGESWGFEVSLPPGFDTSLAGRRNRQPMSSWIARGVKLATGGPLPAGDPDRALLLPAGPRGPAFLVGRNFNVIFSYNAAESYALAIAHLSDRLRGGGGFRTPWPTDDPGLSRAGRRELQRLLIARGHDIGEADGMVGDKTRKAIAREQAALGRETDGRASQRLLESLRAAAGVGAGEGSGP